MNISDYSEKEFNKTEFTILKELNKYYKYYNESKIVNQEYFNNDFDMENYIKHEEIITKKYNNVQLKSIEDDNGGENDDEDNNI